MSDQPSSPSAKKLFGCFTRRERWGLSLRGWLVLILSAGIFGTIWLLNVQPFLAQTRRVDTRILVVEGWVQEYAARAALKEFDGGHYEKIYTTGGPVVGSLEENDFNTLASVGADLLVKVGLPRELVQMVPSHIRGRDRTYSSAVALREYFRSHGLTVKSFNLLTESTHARRSRMLFQDAFGPDVEVGVVAVPDPDYDPAHWWRYSEGVRTVLSESIAWVYAEFLFRPGPQPKSPPPPRMP
jgi:uncharacterized SAM-binding protein YcdF (DUF218 family)